MIVHVGHESIHAEWRESVVCIGTFDGVHLGHRALLGKTVELAGERKCPSVAVTFDRHPMATLAPGREPLAISTLGQNLEMMSRSGVAAVVVLPFDHSLAQMEAETFFEEIVREKLKGAAVVVGHDFAFGHGRRGTPEWLSERIETTVVEALEVEGVRVSSSVIREAVRTGDLDRASNYLDRPFAIDGTVVAGDKLGRTLGYPTINLARSQKQVLPPEGVYVGFAHTRHGGFLAAVSIGTRPTVDGADLRIEAFLLDYPGTEIYGTSVRLEVWAMVREQVKFDDLEALKEQMAEDVREVRKYKSFAWETDKGFDAFGGLWARN